MDTTRKPALPAPPEPAPYRRTGMFSPEALAEREANQAHREAADRRLLYSRMSRAGRRRFNGE